MWGCVSRVLWMRRQQAGQGDGRLCVACSSVFSPALLHDPPAGRREVAEAEAAEQGEREAIERRLAEVHSKVGWGGGEGSSVLDGGC